MGLLKNLPRHEKLDRPRDREQKRVQVRRIYRENEWGAVEQEANAATVGLPFKAVDDYGEPELDAILADFEKRSMILYK